LVFTGLAIHGSHNLINFGTAVTIHTTVAILLLILWAFATFWLFTTGQWKHYIPTTKNMLKVARYYAFGVFKGEAHPFQKTYRNKHNPLQALTYLLLKGIIFPGIWISGIAYMLVSFGVGDITSLIPLSFIAFVHTVSAFAIIIFVILHLYILTIGGFKQHVMPMVTGYDEVELTVEEWAYLEADESSKLQED
jgi:thiosulfate reductase cytochrome b subunit